jgi:hypothetical protein
MSVALRFRLPPPPLAAAWLALCGCLAAGGALAQTKTGTSMGQFLLIEPSARIAGMGNAGVALPVGLDAVYFNPSAIAATDQYGLTIAQRMAGRDQLRLRRDRHPRGQVGARTWPSPRSTRARSTRIVSQPLVRASATAFRTSASGWAAVVTHRSLRRWTDHLRARDDLEYFRQHLH